MKTMFALFAALMLTLAPVRESKASDISTSVVVGVLVANYAGALAGVAASSLLFGTELVLKSGGKEEAAIKATQNDLANFEATGALSINLENSIKDLMAKDASLSEEEALNMIVEASQL